MSAGAGPLRVVTSDGAVWVRAAVTRAGLGLYCPEGVTACPRFVMATLAELAEHGVRVAEPVTDLPSAVALMGALPMPVGTTDGAAASAPAMHADSKACGTCKALARDGKPIEHEQCAARAVLLPPPDQPMYEDLVDLTDEQRKALPARFHTPVFDGLGQPNAWLCQVCWGDGWVAQWPCGPAQEKGAMVFVSEGTAEDIAAELVRLRARVAELEAASPWERAVAGLNALVDADVVFHVEPDGHISAPFSDEHIEWDLKAKRWVLTHDVEDDEPVPVLSAEDKARAAVDRSVKSQFPVIAAFLAEDPHDGPLHHSYALGRDLPEVTPKVAARTRRPMSHYLRSMTGVLHLRRSGPEDDGLSYDYARCGWENGLGREAVPLAISDDPRVCQRCEVIEP